MFTSGQITFAILFIIGFVLVMFFSYRKDFALHKQYYKGSKWILVAFIVFIGLLFVVKSLLKG